MLGLDDLLNDGRLARLFSQDARHCALQLWILQVKSDRPTENRIIYGRLLPYSHSSESWFSTDDDSFRPFDQIEAQLVRINLYLKSSLCPELLRRLSSGQDIAAISDSMQLALSDKLKSRFGSTALFTNELVFRPVAYLLNHDTYDPHLLASPHGSGGAFSAAITRADKGALFRSEGSYNVPMVEAVVQQLNTETGLDFGGPDITRLGDIELIVFPTLDDRERSLLSVMWADTPLALVIRFDPQQVAHFYGFQFQLSITNDSQTMYSAVIRAERDTDGIFEAKFKLSDHLRAIADGTELEIFGTNDIHFRESTLCCRWKCVYMREINFETHLVGHSGGSVTFDWLEKTTRPSASARAKAAVTVNRGDLAFTNRVGGRLADPWVTTNRDLVSLFARLHPPKSEARFFPRWGQSDGEGRLQFVEWFRALLIKHPQQQIIIFDPYFESVGVGLLLLLGTPNADFVVFTSLPRQNIDLDSDTNELIQPVSGRINNLLAACEQNPNLAKRIKLRIYGLKGGRLHDRYILVVGPDGLPTDGFTLSNSFQSAAENYPLLVTPIPADTLLKVEQYATELLAEAGVAQSGCEIDASYATLIFDSATLPKFLRRYEPLLFLENAAAGDVLSAWTSEPSLQGLHGNQLRERLHGLGLLEGNSIAFGNTAGLQNFLNPRNDSLTISSAWDVLGDVLAHSNTNGDCFTGLKHEKHLLDFLSSFLKTSFSRVRDRVEEEVIITGVRFFREPVETLLHSSYRPGHFTGNIKYELLSWAEYFAIKLLWLHEPATLCEITEAQMVVAPLDPQGPDVVRLSLLSQIVGELSLSVMADISESQEDVLLSSCNGLLQWMGLNALERKLEKPDGLQTVLRKIASFSHAGQIRALGWTIHRAAGNPKTTLIYNELLKSLSELLPEKISLEELRRLVDSLRGHMRHLAWAEPWLFRDVIFPLLRDNRVEFDYACDIWVQELVVSLGPGYEHQYKLFDRAREGQTTNITAFLFARSSNSRQQTSLNFMGSILKRQRRIVLQPLASTANWTHWNDALVIATWILAFARWAQFYLSELDDMTNCELDKLERDANNLVAFRPISEWRSVVKGTQSELAAFLDQGNQLLRAKGKIL